LINPLLITADEDNRAPKGAFRRREFFRIVALVRPYRRSLILGLIFSVLFAGLHTLSIGGAFPVFQILLEDEGLHGWVNRSVAGNRLGIDFAPLNSTDSASVLKVHKQTPAEAAGVLAGDELLAPPGHNVKDELGRIAAVPAGNVSIRTIHAAQEAAEVSLTVPEPAWHMRALHYAQSLLPPDRPDTKLWTLGCILLVLVLIAVTSNVCRYVGEVLVSGAVLRALMDLRDQLYAQTLHLPLKFFAGSNTSDVVTRFVQDIQEIQRGLLTLFGKAIREPIHALFLLAFALFIDWRITLTLALIVPIVALIFLSVGRSVKKANRKLLQCYGQMIGALTASLQSLRVVKAYNAEDYEQARLDVVDRNMFRHQLRLAKLDAFLSPMMETVAIIAGSMLIVWLANLVLGGQMTLAKFSMLGATLAVLFDPLRKLTDVYVRIQRSTAGAERVLQVIDQPAERADTQQAAPIQPLQRSIEFNHVSFSYVGAAVRALHDVSLTITRGETLALVGPNGSGKTTLMNLLPRFFDPDSGEVRYDGLNIRNADLVSLRRNIGIVSQESVVFGGTPIENIAYGDKSPDPERVMEAAKRAYADEFISALPAGYKCVIGERGSTLSGGQRQRIAIARAIYHDAPILIFDEATSQIDSESELKIQTAIREFAKGRTTIIIAHRLSTIQFADRIVVMNAGRILDSGPHGELLGRCSLYRTLCETQLVA
jgi:ATP-binding cassette, subfamily B, bacterial MsbA